METLRAQIHNPGLGPEAAGSLEQVRANIVPFGGDLMIRTMPVEAPSSKTIIPTTSQERTSQATVDGKGKTDTAVDARERLDTTYD